jgi:hypothetical protein
VGLNPSTADENADDNTIRRCIGFARDWGFSRLLMVNVFAFRATRPVDLMKSDDPVGPENLEWITRARDASQLVLVAWGNHGKWRGRDQEVIGLLPGAYSLGVTKSGAPRHPLYVRSAVKPMRYLGR